VKKIEADTNAVSEAVDFATKKLLSEVQKTGSYRAVKSALAERGVASFLYLHSRRLAGLAILHPMDFYTSLCYEVEDFLNNKRTNVRHGRRFGVHYLVTSWDIRRQTSTVVLWRSDYDMNLRRIRQASKKPLLPTQLR